MLPAFIDLPREKWHPHARRLQAQFRAKVPPANGCLDFDGLFKSEKGADDDPMLTFRFHVRSILDGQLLLTISGDMGILDDAHIYLISGGRVVTLHAALEDPDF